MFGIHMFISIIIGVLLLRFCSLTVHSDDKTPLKLSFLGSTNGLGKLFAGAFFIAIDHVNKNASLLNGYRLDYMFNDTSGNSLKAINAMTDHYGIKTVGFIGPDISCHCESNIAAAWNLPMIGYVSVDLKLLSLKSK
jgi:hypothetical protein